MLFFSEKTGRTYKTAAECEADELKQLQEENREKIRREREARIAQEQLEAEKKRKEELAAARKVAAEKVENAYKAMIAAQNAYKEELEKFCKEYGSYHTTISDKEIPSLFSIFNPMLLDWFK